ncbi:Hsp70 family protein [Kineosporia succinea]|uniref:Molecular chaperone DnaK (HSP70) n=1 Tax=Kineosporia succinea TaxID=84632 RepID=A0ABT9P519_9ACTN|nr:Hsp70 family protein [Kineosporia succinea]MDP9827784.1 molecular chaperone DnaK (HSP70) [Kineosporia succinea]
MSYGLGIDVGTAFTAAAVSRGGPVRTLRLGRRSPLMPSVVRALPDGTLAAGTGEGGAEIAAHLFRRRLGDSAPMSVGETSSTPAELMTALLTGVLERVKARLGGPPDRVVLTCPAGWGPYRREQFAEVTRRAGLSRDRVTLITDAEAVVVHHHGGRPSGGPAPIAVYDAGGSTFDATVIRTVRVENAEAGPIGVLGVPESLEWFGGVDLDDAVMTHLDRAADGAVGLLDPARPEDTAALRRLREACVRAKESVWEAGSVDIDAPGLGRSRPVTLTREALQAWLRPPLEAGLPVLRRVLDSVGVRPADLGEVLLVGGTARIPLVATMLTEDLGRPVTVLSDPQHRAALGAAMLAGRAQRPVGPRA